MGSGPTIPTQYTLDLAAPLVTVLAERTDTATKQYLYGLGDSPLASYTGTWTYLSGRDGLNSVRQETDGGGNVLVTRRFDPYGVPLSGNGGSPCGFTGEQTDVTGLVFLRARYMRPGLGMFLSRDPWEGYELWPGTYNGFNYAMGNPANLSDPAGFQAGSNGLMIFAICFDIHTGSHGKWPTGGDPFMVTTKAALDICEEAYNRFNWDNANYNFDLDTTHLPRSAYDLFGWYVHNRRLNGTNGSDRLWFDANEPLTKELAQSSLVNDVRDRYYQGHNTGGPTEYEYDAGEVFATALFDTPKTGKGGVAISFFIGSFWYQVKTVHDEGGARVGFRIDNDTTLSSGTHIGRRYKSQGAYLSVERLVKDNPDLANKPIYDVIRDNPELISILSNRTKEASLGWLGGANLYQTFTWTEKRDCSLAGRLPWDVWTVLLDIKVWGDFKDYTVDPQDFPAQ